MFKKVLLAIMVMLILSPVLLFAQTDPDEPNYTFPVIILTLVGAFAPGLISLVVKAVKESWLRYIIALLLSAVIGFIGVLLLKIPINLTNLVIVLPAFATLTNTAWKLWWHKIIKG
jgi:hypothetical protein